MKLKLEYKSKKLDELKKEIVNEIQGTADYLLENYTEKDMVYLAKLVADFYTLNISKKQVQKTVKSETGLKRLSHQGFQKKLYAEFEFKTERFTLAYQIVHNDYNCIICEDRTKELELNVAVWVCYKTRSIIVNRNDEKFDKIIKKVYDNKGYVLELKNEKEWEA